MLLKRLPAGLAVDTCTVHFTKLVVNMNNRRHFFLGGGGYCRMRLVKIIKTGYRDTTLMEDRKALMFLVLDLY